MKTDTWLVTQKRTRQPPLQWQQHALRWADGRKTPPRDGQKMFFTAILDNSGNKSLEGRALLNMSARWCWDLIGMSLRDPEETVSHTRWQSISICFVRSWKVGFEAIWIAAWLSQNKRIGESTVMWKSFNKCDNQKSSLVVAAKALYSASEDDLETVACFLAF